MNMSPTDLFNQAIKFLKLLDYNNYFIYMTMAANLNHSDAIIYLNKDYDANNTSKQDHLQTLDFYVRTSNYSYSANYLGYMYENGIGIDQNYSKAIELYELAIESNDPAAMNNLANMYEHAKGLERNYFKAIELYEKAIKLNYSTAMNNLARMYQCGKGIERNYSKAIELYNQAIKLDNSTAMFNLAFMYEEGIGIEKNYSKAIELYKNAIALGDLDALNNLTSIYRNSKKLFNESDINDYFIEKYPEKLKIIFGYSDKMIKCLQENYVLKEENNKLKQEITLINKLNTELIDHINFMPDGAQYLETKKNWENKLISFSHK